MKILKILAFILILFFSLLLSIPLFLESKISSIVQNYADKNLNADLSFDFISLSLIRSFPNAKVSVDNLKLINKAPFENQTLVSANSLAFEIPIADLFNGDSKPITVNEIIANELLLTLKSSKKGIVNYDIVKTKQTNTNTKSTDTSAVASEVIFDIKKIEINNSAITHIDEATGVEVFLTDFNHKSKGIFSAKKSELDTKTQTSLSVTVDNTSYLSNTALKFEALFGMDLNQYKFTFKDNTGFINNLPLEFNGFLQLLDEDQMIDFSFKTPETTFKNFLAVLPKAYSNNIENIKTTGSFEVKGNVKGLFSQTTIPKLDINIVSKNASFQYPDLPKGVKNININATVKNKSGSPEDTFIDVNQLNFTIDGDTFKSEAHIKNLTGNPIINAHLVGVLNLANITKAYPINLENQLTGILRANFSTTFDLKAIETNAFERIKNTGTISASKVVFSSKGMANPFQINSADISFKTGTIQLNHLDAQTGKSDFKASGNLYNLIGFLFSNKNLQGNFNLSATEFFITDFMIEDEKTKETSNKSLSVEESLQIPDFLDCTLVANAKTVYYDNLVLKNVQGLLKIKNQKATLTNMTSDIFDGKLGITGNVTTKEKSHIFDMSLNIHAFDIPKSFNDLKMLRVIAPIAKVLKGKVNSTIHIEGLLNANFTPDLNTISGNLLAKLFTQQLNTNNSLLLSELANNFKFIDFDKLDLKDVKTSLSFDNGSVTVKPFTVNYQDIAIDISGGHSFTNAMNYSMVFNLPAKYLGSDVNHLIGAINDSEFKAISIPVTVNIGGTFSKPNIKSNLSKGVSDLTKQLIVIQKQKLVSKNKTQVNALIADVLGEKKKGEEKAINTEETKTINEKVKKSVNNVIGGWLGGNKGIKRKTDSTSKE